MLNRREFIRNTAVFVSGAFLLSPERLLAFGSQEPPPVRELTGDPIVDLFYAELDSYPKNSVAHSVGEIEVVDNPASLRSIVRGVTHGRKNRAKYFVFEFGREEFLNNIEYRREIVELILEELRSAWAKSKIGWENSSIGWTEAWNTHGLSRL